jgi:putative transposase
LQETLGLGAAPQGHAQTREAQCDPELPKYMHASVRAVRCQAWELDDAERLIRNLARRLEQLAPRVAAAILQGLDEMLTVVRLGLPLSLRRSLACTNTIENMMGTTRRVCRNVKQWRDASMALTLAGSRVAAGH